MADCDYNFLRSSAFHGPYLDSNPCWILVPACPFEEIKTWKPGTPYNVLAVANGFGNKTTEEAYRFLCTKLYNDSEHFDVATRSVFRRSRCTKSHLDEATKNLRAMVLAMAETLVGRPDAVKPYNILLKNNKGLEKRPENRDQWNKEHCDAELFEATMNSIRKNGVQVPEVKGDIKENGNLDGVELLVFHLYPKQVDFYPDPMLLLVKAAINWSWYCEQKLLPACGDGLNVKVDDDVEEEDGEEAVVPTTPVPEYIEFMPMPVRVVTPD